VYDRAPQEKSHRSAKELARPSCARQHDHTAQHGLAVLGGTAVPVVERHGLSSFRDLFLGALSFLLLFLAFPLALGLREIDWRESKNLDLGFQFMLFY